MTMTLSGDGAITGLVAGGLPDATIQTADIVDGAVTPTKLSGLVFTLANQTPLPGVAASLSWAHGLGVTPVSAELEIVCLTADNGYSVGDVVTPFCSSNGSYYNPFSVGKNSTAVFARTGSNVSFAIVHATAGSTAAPTAANWAWRFKVRAA